jgi:hypothetical protein
VSAGTPAGSVAAPVFTGTPGAVPAQTISWPGGVPTFTGQAFSGVITHTHTIQMQGSATPATTGTHIVNSTATGGSSRAAISPDQANAPAGAVASITPAGTIAWPPSVPTNSSVNFTPVGTNSAPAFTGTPLGTHAHTFTATGTVSAPSFTGNALAPHAHNVTAAGTVSAPVFSGQQSSVVQPYIVVYMWKRIS